MRLLLGHVQILSWNWAAPPLTPPNPNPPPAPLPNPGPNSQMGSSGDLMDELFAGANDPSNPLVAPLGSTGEEPPEALAWIGDDEEEDDGALASLEDDPFSWGVLEE